METSSRIFQVGGPASIWLSWFRFFFHVSVCVCVCVCLCVCVCPITLGVSLLVLLKIAALSVFFKRSNNPTVSNSQLTSPSRHREQLHFLRFSWRPYGKGLSTWSAMPRLKGMQSGHQAVYSVDSKWEPRLRSESRTLWKAPSLPGSSCIHVLLVYTEGFINQIHLMNIHELCLLPSNLLWACTAILS